MQSGAIQLLKNHFDALSQRTPDEDIEFWFARGIMEPLGYARWENFQTAINRAIESCKTTGYAADDHFRGVTKMLEIGKETTLPLRFHAHHYLRGELEAIVLPYHRQH